MIDRWMKNVIKTENDCWLYQTQPKSRYAKIRFRGRNTGIHRAFFIIHRGPIPDGLVIDHLCRNKKCVNPSHMEPVTIKENVLRGIGITAQNSRKTVCDRGHSLEDSIPHGAGRRCRECDRRISRDYQRRKRAGLLQP